MEATLATTVPPQQPAQASLQENRALIDRITYLASLASKLDDIDTRMETLREVTASWDQTVPLSTANVAALENLEHQLKDYLVNVDPLRTFTAESLEARLQHNSATSHGIRQLDRTTKALLAVIFLSIGAAIAGLVAPFMLSLHTRTLLTIPLLFSGLHIGIVWFYVTALRNFNKDVRHVLIYFCVAAGIFAIGFSHFVIIELFDLARYPAFQYAGITPLFGIPFILMFLGLRIYAKLVGVTSRLLAWPATAIAAVVCCGAVVVLPHVPVASETFLDLAQIWGFAIVLFGFMGSVLAGKIRKSVSAGYAKQMAVLFWYLRLNSISGAGVIIAMCLMGELRGGALSIVLAIGGIPTQSILLYAGYLFKKETVK